MTAAEKKAFSSEAEKVFAEPMLRGVMEEYAENMRFVLRGLPEYGLKKVAFYAAVIARAHALGVPVETLRMNDDERADQAMDLVERMVSGA